MSINGWGAYLRDWLTVGKILVGALVALVAVSLYVSDRLGVIELQLSDLTDRVELLTISSYESQLIQAELSITYMQDRSGKLGPQEQRRLEELQITRRKLIDRLRALQSRQP